MNEPIIVNTGRFYASATGPEMLGLTCSGTNALTDLALRLWQVGTDPDRTLEIYRQGVRVGATTIAEAAKGMCRTC
jgi:hypothetical protein